jgi:hypothetical protein
LTDDAKRELFVTRDVIHALRFEITRQAFAIPELDNRLRRDGSNSAPMWRGIPILLESPFAARSSASGIKTAAVLEASDRAIRVSA